MRTALSLAESMGLCANAIVAISKKANSVRVRFIFYVSYTGENAFVNVC